MNDPFAIEDDSRPSAPWLNGLNPEQQDAVTATEGPVLVLSGAGTGKTRVLTARLAEILNGGRVRPWQCLVVTFTNKAAREMKERVGRLVGPGAEGLWLGTFHSIGVRILRRHAEAVGLSSNFTILDADDQLRLLKQVMEAEHLDLKKTPPQGVMAQIQRWKDRGIAPDKPEVGGLDGKLYQAYQARLLALNACDFGDLLLHTLTLFLNDAALLEQYQEQFRYILVDEYQDTNVSQYLWLRLLAQKHRNLCCVGDDDQSIYSWRGAEVGNILRFEKDFPGARVIRLERNYRSTPHILACASHLIAHNAGRLGKTLRSGLPPAGTAEKVGVRGVWDGESEARAIVEEVEALQRAGEKLASVAILVRAGFQTREFEDRLISQGVPYRILGGPRFYERAEIRDAMAYFRLVVSPADGLAFERIVNLPKRGLGEAALATLNALAGRTGLPLFEAAKRLVTSDDLKPKPRAALAQFAADIDRWRATLDGMDHADLAATILDESGYIEMWKADKSPEAPGRVENLKELISALGDFESLPVFLEHVALVMDNDEKAEGDRLTVMTLHGAKGLEFDTVFLPGWEEGVFPHSRALSEDGGKGLEEERRLAYVGITRARKRARIFYAANRRIYNKWQDCLPSRFIAELPEAHIDHVSATGYAQPRWSAPRAVTWTAPAQPVAESDFRPGERVFHTKFGPGTVKAVEGDRLDIHFDHAGPKKVLASFVEKP